MKIAFQKWEATGNDFIFVDEVESSVSPEDVPLAEIIAICCRQTGRGADGVVFFGSADNGQSTMTLVNSDGSRGDMCGNALRCLAKILQKKTGTTEHAVQLRTRTVQVRADQGNESTVFMGPADAISGTRLFQGANELDELVKGPGYLVSFGNPHYVQPVSSISDDWENLGQSLQVPADRLLQTGGINAGFVQVEPDPNGVFQLRVYERGAGATKSCGSGACAASAVLENKLHKSPPHRIALTGGTLTIDRANGDFLLSGPANFEYEGYWEL